MGVFLIDYGEGGRVSREGETNYMNLIRFCILPLAISIVVTVSQNSTAQVYQPFGSVNFDHDAQIFAPAETRKDHEALAIKLVPRERLLRVPDDAASVPKKAEGKGRKRPK